jgi:glycosyltransferase involved in cell wall biosynthesis
VICIFYQAERYLREAVDSVLAQDFRDFELLLVDDGSTDGGTSIAKGYQSANPDRVRYVEHPDHVNHGMSATRNLGLQHAVGELIAFIDADDRWRPSKLTDQVALIDRMPEVDAVCGAVKYWLSHSGGEDEVIVTGHVLDRPIRPIDALLNLYPLGRGDPPCPSDLLMRRTIVDAVGGFEASFTGPLQLYEDQAFLLKFYLRGTIYFSAKVWLDYRLHEQSCTSWVHREGLRPEVRRQCLEWFEVYLRTTPYRSNLRIRLALFRALRPYRFPRATRFGRAVKSIARPLLRKKAALQA